MKTKQDVAEVKLKCNVSKNNADINVHELQAKLHNCTPR